MFTNCRLDSLQWLINKNNNKSHKGIKHIDWIAAKQGRIDILHWLFDYG